MRAGPARSRAVGAALGAGLLALLAWLWPAADAAAQAGGARPLELNTARAVVEGGTPASPPQAADFAAARDIALPDNWMRTRPGFTGVVWYAVSLDAALAAFAGTDERLAVLVPRAANRAEFWLNGERLESGVRNNNTRSQAVFIELQAHALRPAGNLLQVRVEGEGNARDGLSSMEFGPASLLRPAYDVRRVAQTVLPLLLLLLVVGATFATLPLWLKTRQRAHLLFLLLCLGALPRGLVVLLPEAARPSEAALTLVVVTSLFSTVMVPLLVLEFLGASGRNWDRYRRALLGLTALLAAAGILWALTADLRPRTFVLLHLILLGAMLVALMAQIRAAFIDPRPVHVATAIALCSWMVTVVHDFAVFADYAAFDAIMWSPIAALAVFLSLVWRTIAGLAVARASADHEVRNAVTRVADAHGRALEQLRVEYEERKAAEREAVIAAERTRLLHDLHDGMGSQLITALRMTRRDEVPREEVARVIEDSLEDMRLIIDSLDLEERDLLPLLGNLRYRLEPRLNAIGISLQWEVEPLPELDYLTPETGLAIVRIVQEAVNNALRHGAARTIVVRARAGAQVDLSITDDGCGFDVAGVPAASGHRGLGAMRARAQKLGARLGIESGITGTRITLALPLGR